MNFLKGLFIRPKVALVGTLRWKIKWSDIGSTETGYFQLFESNNGKRSFDITNQAMMTKTSEHPGYAECVAWVNGGMFPQNAIRLVKGEPVYD